jgi:hypothetical protein
MKEDSWTVHVPCCGERHAITIRSQGPVTLHAHRGQTSSQFALFEGMDNQLGCMEFLKVWRTGLGKGSDPDSSPSFQNLLSDWNVVNIARCIQAIPRMRRRLRKVLPLAGAVSDNRPPRARNIERAKNRVARALGAAWGQASAYKIKWQSMVPGHTSVSFYCHQKNSYDRPNGQQPNVLVEWTKERAGHKVLHNRELTFRVPLRWIRVSNMGAAVVEGILVMDLLGIGNRRFGVNEQPSLADLRSATRATVLALHEVAKPTPGSDPFTLRRATIARETASDPWDALIWME